jgi:hypothetical protein
MKKVVYTVLLGERYKLNEPIFKNKDWEFICFTDQDLKSKYWKIIKVEGGKKKSREIKIRSDQFFNYDICLYIDAKFVVKCDLNNFVSKYLKTSLCVMKHNKRNCVYKEGDFCIKLGIDKQEIIQLQLKKYATEGMPDNFGLFAPGIMIKKNVEDVNIFMKLWYDEVEEYSYRDIISLSYMIWKHPIKLSLMPFKETYFQFTF